MDEAQLLAKFDNQQLQETLAVRSEQVKTLQQQLETQKRRH